MRVPSGTSPARASNSVRRVDRSCQPVPTRIPGPYPSSTRPALVEGWLAVTDRDDGVLSASPRTVRPNYAAVKRGRSRERPTRLCKSGSSFSVG
jgi:hypothetical protein